jgi:hypothetical protein
MIDGDDCAAITAMNERQEKPKYLEETCPSVTLPPQIPHDDLGSIPGRRGGKPATTATARHGPVMSNSDY